jgi:predicted nucleic acid-binding protein
MLRSPRIAQWLQDLRAYSRVALDTNVVIYALDDVAPYKELAQHLLRLMQQGLITGVVSTIVESETLVKPLRQQDWAVLAKVELFFRSSPNLVIRSFDRAVARRAAMVRAGSRLPLPDAIIVATGLEERCDALVGNDRSIASRSIGIPYLYLDNYVS